MTFKPLLLILVCFPMLAFANAVTYGDLIAEDIPNDLAGKNHVQFATGYDVTNPYLNTYNFSAVYLREVTSFADVGVEGNAFSAHPSRYNQTLVKDLDVFGVQAEDDRPKASVYGIAQLRLLQGRVNLMSLKGLPFRFNVRAGSGLIWLSDTRRQNCGTWGINSEVYFNPKWGMALRFDQDLQNFWGPGSSIYRNRLSLGLNYVY